ncbi:MAG: SH3 domain-containing protein [Chitinophagales bacterium]
MALQEKYKRLIDEAKSSAVSDLQIREQNSVLYIDGSVSNAKVKDSLWATYDEIDPDYRSGDLVLNVNVATPAGSKAKVATKSSNLNIRKGPGTDQPIVGKAAHDELVTILSNANEQWSLIKTENGEEGYVYSQYLEPA